VKRTACLGRFNIGRDYGGRFKSCPDGEHRGNNSRYVRSMSRNDAATGQTWFWRHLFREEYVE